MASVVATRFAHTSGHVSLFYKWDGEGVISVGSDGEMRVWSGIDDDDCDNHLIGDEALAVTASKDRIFTAASGTNTVQAYNMDGDGDGIMTRFTADATCLDTTADGKLLASGSADMTAKVTDTSSFNDTVFKGHEGPILSVSLDPKLKFLATSSCDGTVRLWEIAEKKQVKSWKWLPQSNDFSASPTVCCLKFSPDGSRLAVPHDGGIEIVGRGTWELETTLKPGKPLADKEMFTAAAWSEQGTEVLAATNQGKMVVWGVPGGKIKHELTTGRKFAVCALAWNPVKNEGIFADVEGHWGLIEDLGDASNDEKQSEDVGEELSQVKDAIGMEAEDLDGLFNDDDDDDENSFSISRVQAETGFTRDEEGNLIVKDDAKSDVRPTSAASSASGMEEPVARPPPQPRLDLQDPFQPGASPGHLQARFLVYNSVGIVKSYTTEEESSLDVEFHDSSVHHPLHLNNNLNHSMAALNDKVLALAAEGSDDAPSKLVVNYFGSSDLTREWSLDMPEGEDIACLTVGDGWVAVATDHRMLRIFTSGGVQREVISLPGPVVSLAGNSSSLLVIIHSAHPLPGDQSLSCMVYQVSVTSAPSKAGRFTPLPLAPRSSLAWVGFSDTGAAVTTDSAGWVRMRYQGLWMPIANTKSHTKGKSDHYYVVSVDQMEGVVRCILCKGARFPPTVPRPVPTALPIEQPLCGISSEKGGLEVKASNMNLQARMLEGLEVEDGGEKQAELAARETECLMKLFALACRSDHESRAVEICRLMPNVESIQLAIKYAAKLRRIHLASKLGELAMEVQEEAERKAAKAREDRDDDDMEVEREESQDMFASQEEENPLVRAAARRQATVDNPRPVVLKDTQSQQSENRNPFAKKTSTGSASTTPSRSGIVFDSVKVKPTPVVEKAGFGGMISPVGASSKPKPAKRSQQQPLFKKIQEKENTGENGQGELKGFALWMAENKSSLGGTGDDAQEEGLSQWKALGKEEKDKYRTPRVPALGDKGGDKRKRSDGDEAVEKKQKTSVSSKLSGFAFAEK